MDQLDRDNQLLLRVVEHLKQPLINIARQSELDDHNLLKDIGSLAESSIQLIDGYVLGLNSNEQQSSLELEPISVSEVLQDTADILTKIAKIYGCILKLNIEGKFVPVMSRKREMASALTLIGQSLIESNNKEGEIILSAYKAGSRISVGVFSPDLNISNETFSKDLNQNIRSRQGLPNISHTPAAGIYIADLLFERLSSKLKISHHNKLAGLTGQFLPSYQLTLI
ncbi:MAG TPA: hypothetical protein VMR76_02335 [Candidatus Saccharimonadia bacterium]|nr:hypothetical protein [Candidatus Saccharimonadia bacterium]